MRSWKKLLSLTAACALSVSLLAGCSGTTTPAAEPAASGSGNTTATEGKMFNIALTAPFTGFDPLRTNDSASTYTHGTPPKSGTVYLCCADGEGNMVSYIQSNYMGFGSGVVVTGTGVSLQNRGHDFSLNAKDANSLQPGKRSYHTIIPGFLLKDGRPVDPFGVMGGYMQPQGHVQVVMNYVDFHLDPQQALDAPRWQWMRDNTVTVETRFSMEMARKLQRLGHNIRADLSTPSFGRGQMIVRLDNGVLVGGTESRTDSNIACF